MLLKITSRPAIVPIHVMPDESLNMPLNYSLFTIIVCIFGVSSLARISGQILFLQLAVSSVNNNDCSVIIISMNIRSDVRVLMKTYILSDKVL